MDILNKENEINKNILSNTCLMFSPTKPLTKGEKAKIEFQSLLDKDEGKTLLCEKFQNPLHLDFGTVIPRSTVVRKFMLQNPNTQRAVTIGVDSALDKLGISVSLGKSNESEIEIPPSGNDFGTVYWTPMQDMTLYKSIALRMDQKLSLQLKLHGTAGTGKVHIIMFFAKLSVICCNHSLFIYRMLRVLLQQ